MKILSSLNKIGIINKKIKNLICKKLKFIPQKKINDENKKLTKRQFKSLEYFFRIFSILQETKCIQRIMLSIEITDN